MAKTLTFSGFNLVTVVSYKVFHLEALLLKSTDT